MEVEQIRAEPGIPLEGQIAFASIDSKGTPGSLNTWVLETLGFDLPKALPPPEDLVGGFSFYFAPKVVLVFVVTIDFQYEPLNLLRKNLEGALIALQSSAIDDRRLWIPLMGTGDARLSDEISLKTTIDAILSSGILQARPPFQIDLSLDPRTDAERTAFLRHILDEKLQSERVSPTAPIAEESPKTPPVAHAAPFYADQPATHDTLYRRSIAEALATIVRDVHPRLSDKGEGDDAAAARPVTSWNALRDIGKELWARIQGRTASDGKPETAPSPPLDVGRTYVVHIHGPWGSGKSSLLGFLGKSLADDRIGTPWVIVNFNAWRHQTTGPPWWTLLTQVYAQAIRQVDRRTRLELRWSELWWRFRSGWAPYVMGFAILLWLVAFFSMPSDPVGEKALGEGGPGAVAEAPKEPGSGQKASPSGLQITLSNGLKVLASIFTVWAGFSAFAKHTRLGPARTASAFLELSSDPQQLLARRYRDVVHKMERPIAVLIDDLDRCDGSYIVELMQCLQTVYRDAPVVYVVAADRNWVRASYETVYQDYAERISEPGRPLGHLFLEKIFQLSVSVPQLSLPVQREYWNSLIHGDTQAEPETHEELRREAYETLKTAGSDEEVRQKVESIDDPNRRRAAAAAAFQRLQEEDLRQRREHFLSTYAKWLEPNPRSMKRLLNAYGFKFGYGILAELETGSQSDSDALVRWTIVEIRWPTFADELARYPERIGWLTSRPADAEIREGLAPLYDSDQVREILDDFTPDLIRSLTSGEGGGLSAGAAAA